jgi:hypothetical protein
MDNYLASETGNPRNSAFMNPFAILPSRITGMSNEWFEVMILRRKMTKQNEN